MIKILETLWGTFAIKSTEKLLEEAIIHYESDEMESAVAKFRQLAKLNNEEAYLYLSLIYKDGDGVIRDELESKRLKKKYVQIVNEKASEGDIKYKLKYAYILQYGDGIDSDENQAIKLLKELASEGLAEAQFHLYTIYQHGFCGQNVDFSVAEYWLDLAFESNWPEAIYIKSLQLLSDDRNSTEAVALLKKSADLGFFPAEELLNERNKN